METIADTIFNILTVIGIVWVIWLWVRDATAGVRRRARAIFGARPPAPRGGPEPPKPAVQTPPDYRQPEQRDARAWMRALAADRDGAPHLLVLGPTGSGKTTLVLALLGVLDGGDAVIVSPKNARDDSWGGFPVVRLAIRAHTGPDWSAIAAAIAAVRQELYRRLADDAAPRSPLWLVIDEMPMVIEEIPDVSDTLRYVWQLGRSVGIRVIGITQTALVRDLGLEGRSNARDNLTVIETRRPAGSDARLYAWGREAEARPLTLDGIAALAREASVAVRPWRPTPDEPSEAFSASGRGETPRPSVRPSVPDGDSGRDLGPPMQTDGRTIDRRAVLAAMREAGVSREQARRLCDRLGWGFANELWTEVGR